MARFPNEWAELKPIDPRLARYASATKVYLALAVVLGVTLTGLVIAQASLISAIIAGVFLGGETLAMVWPAMASLLAVFVARALVVWAGEAAGELAAVRVKSQLRSQLTRKLLALGPAFLDDQRSGELVTTATRGVDALDAYFARYLPQLVLGCLAPLALVVWVFRLDRLSAVILAVTIPLIPIFMILIGLEAQRKTQRQWQFLGRLSSHFLDVLQGLPTLRVFGRGRAQVSIIRQITDQYRQATMGVLRVAFLSSLVLELVATLGTAVVAVSIGLRLLDGSIGLPEGLTILILAPEIYLPLRQVGVQFHASMEGNEAAQRIFQALETPLPEGSGCLLPTPDLRQAEICFRRVSFGYPTRPVPVLRELDLRIRPGERVAIVGPSGAGKSTVLSLLLRFGAATDGTITVNGHPIDNFALAAWREQIAWVPQRAMLFRGTIAENIRFGNPDADFAAVREAARNANALAFIEALPDGFDTRLGERGTRLSAGQRQRISLARAFVRNAPLVLLDEPTANLDFESEAAIGEALRRIMVGRTVILVAHRPALLDTLDRVVYLENGRVGIRGPHRGPLPVREGTGVTKAVAR